jgi:hypothetical protein
VKRSGLENANHEFVAEVPVHGRIAHDASEDKSGDESWNITTCRDIPSDILIDLTSDNTGVCMTESSFGKSDQRSGKDLVNVRNIPSTADLNRIGRRKEVISVHSYAWGYFKWLSWGWF